MKYLGILFIFLFAFAIFVTFTVIAEGDIENILNTADEQNGLLNPDETDNIQVFKNYIIKENEFAEPENFINSKTSEYFKYSEYSGENTKNIEKQIIISVYDAKTNEIESIDLNEYLCGVVFSEMPSSFEIEALKAQAVAARSFCVYKMLCSTDAIREEHHGADICNDYTHCKDYISYENACEKYSEEYILPLWEKIKNAVWDTENEIITYESEPAITVFHAISGKETESAENVWGNAVPYLVSVPSEEENNKNEIRNYITESIYNADEFKDILISNGFSLRADFSKNESVWVTNIKLNSSGRVDTVDICGKTVTGRRLREIFALRSTDFTLEYKNQAFIFTVIGYGHGVGMSQYGANLMAKEGKNYKEILLWYYTGVEINQAGKFF
ncbi:MAG: stage II sporulation protein D [Oscillospiraceae bacterium]|nr:stage II sporulation protein D [Oscillospiraceae bacterium]